MEDRFYIKVCGLTDPQNIKKIVDLGVDFIGLIFYDQSKRYVGDFVDANYIKSLTGRVNKVGVYVNEDIETVLEDVEDMDLQYVQLHGEETPAYCAKVRKHAKVIKAFGINSKFEFDVLKKYEKDVNWFLFDTKTTDYGGSGQKFDWKLLKKYKLKKPAIISGGISLDDAIQIKKLPYKFIKAVDLNSKFEEEPGIKDVDMVYTFMEYLKA